MYNKINYSLLFLTAAGAYSCSGEAKKAEIKEPNIVFILADDYSCGEHGFYGNEIIQTPNLDKLASESVWFDNFHVGATSAPTRSQLMTGKHEFRVGVTHTMYPRAYLSLDEKLLPQYFTEAGYSTGHFGKWHLGNDTFDDEYSARARGFQYSIVSDYLKHFDPELRVNGEMTKFNGYRTDILFNEAIKWVDGQLEQDNPFFCYIALNSAHKPFDCPQKYKDMYKGKTNKEDSEVYYGMVTNLDENVGKVINHLKEKGIYDNTILIYITDNGHVANEYNAGMRGGKGTEFRGGTRVPALFHCPDMFEGGRKITELGSAMDFLPTMLDICNIKLDKEIDGVSLLPLITGEKESYPDRFIVSHTGRWADGKASESKYRRYAVQDRRYRLVNNKMLFDIDTDPGETTNVIDQHPELVAKMRAFYDEWWETTLPLMINEQRAIDEGGSRMSAQDVIFRKKQAELKKQQQ